MACSITVTGRAIPCKDKIGGIDKVYIKEYSGDEWGTITAGEIASTGTAGSEVDYFEFEIPRNSGSFNQTINSSVENGTIFYSQVLELTFPNQDATDNVELADLVKSRLSVIVVDNNGNYFAMGHTLGAEATGGAVSTGTAKGDLNGFQIQLTAEEAIPAPFVDKDDVGLDLNAAS
jgi:hypothetical protein